MSVPMATAPRRAPVKLRLALAVGTVLLTRVTLRWLRFHHVVGIVRRLQRRPRRPASPCEVLAVLAAIDAAAAWLPCRVACLERSLTAVVLLAGRRRGVIWHMGIRTPPFAMHAWLSLTTGRILGEAESTADYEPLLVISPPEQLGMEVW